MDVYVSLDHRFLRGVDGSVWTSLTFDYTFWEVYGRVFEKVNVIARTEEIKHVSPKYKRADGESVVFLDVPLYRTPREFLIRCLSIKRAINALCIKDSAVIARVPSVIGSLLVRKAQESKQPYALEVIADPYDVFSPGATHHILRPIYRLAMTGVLRRQCRNAMAVAYVTQRALQERYPCRGFSMGVSDVVLADTDFLETPRVYPDSQTSFTVIFVGMLELLYKAPDILIDAVATCVSRGFDLKLVVVGDGRFREPLSRRDSAAFLGSRLQFLGQLPSGKDVFEALDRADLFVLPSRQEGLPRAMVEAMARALPCIGSRVGGIPELLRPECLVNANDVSGLAVKICELISDPSRMTEESKRNLEKAKEYRFSLLLEKRKRFYEFVRDATSRHLNLKLLH